ncbi:MAG: hypothetical protein K8S97_11040, partial [Anaerolineae bacterium]|nr:hypothetical protein [Anaerolineae bacterium]
GYVSWENFPDATAEDWALTEALILALRDAVEADGRAFRLAIAPTELQVQETYRDDYLTYCELPEWVNDIDGYQARLRAFLDANGIAYLDLLPALRAEADAANTELYFAGNDVHWTPAGHDIVTDALYDWLAWE